MAWQDLTGRHFGRLQVLGKVPNHTKDNHTMYECRCSCGKGKIVRATSTALTSGAVKSCGCLRDEHIVALRTKWHTPEEKEIATRFKVMKKRCYNPNDSKYPRWGGRGITICKEWLDDKSKFVEWAKTHGFKPGLTINRIDNDGPYSPENCEWVNNKVQSNNRSNNVRFEIDGEIHTLTEWSEITGIDYESLRFSYHHNTQKFMDRIVNSPGFENRDKPEEIAAVLKEGMKDQLGK